jgi:hypothetical protein
VAPRVEKDRGGQGSGDGVESGKRREEGGSPVTSRGEEQGRRGALRGREKNKPVRGGGVVPGACGTEWREQAGDSGTTARRRNAPSALNRGMGG